MAGVCAQRRRQICRVPSSDPSWDEDHAADRFLKFPLAPLFRGLGQNRIAQIIGPGDDE